MSEVAAKKPWNGQWRLGRSPVGCVQTSEQLSQLFQSGVQLYYVSALGRLGVAEKVLAAGGRVTATMLVEYRGAAKRTVVTQSCRACGLNKNHQRTERAGYFFSTADAAIKYAAWVKEGVRAQSLKSPANS